VVSINMETLESTQIFCALNESALCLSIDFMSKIEQKALFLTVGTNSKVLVFKQDLDSDSPFEKISVTDTSDNVSCVKTVDSENGPACIFGTYNGRVALFSL